ncbi:MAG: TlpA disulfide reductase family protein [Oligoflexia bacterium]|nr:TlpA disulfide reductase family protein [Oligoflexia bacterium]
MTNESEKTPSSQKKATQIKMLGVLFTVAAIVFLAGGAALWVRSLGSLQKPAAEKGGAPEELKIGSQIPDFTMRRFGENDWIKLSALQNKVIMINFWASWCEACVVEMPSIVKLRDAYRAKGFEVAGINLDETPDQAIPRLVKKLNIDFPVYTDPEGKIAEIFDVHAIPLTVILDSKRRILMLENGDRDWNSEEVRSKLEKWLSG